MRVAFRACGRRSTFLQEHNVALVVDYISHSLLKMNNNGRNLVGDFPLCQTDGSNTSGTIINPSENERNVSVETKFPTGLQHFTLNTLMNPQCYTT